MTAPEDIPRFRLMPEKMRQALYENARRRWLAGECPCCGLDGGTNPKPGAAIAEGVRLCEVCTRGNHHLDSEHVALLLAAIVKKAR